MAQDPASSAPEWYWTPPFRLVTAGVGMAMLAALLHLAGADSMPMTVLRVVLVVTGLILAGGGVWWGLATHSAEDLEKRLVSTVLLSVASCAVIASWAALDPDWDSLRMFLWVAWWATFAAAVIVLLPSVGRRIVFTIMVVFHFGGLLTATTAVQLPNNAPLPWLPSYVWNKVYRHYLYFMYLNNAYHFYSPEPGPPTLVWFRIEFEKGPGEKKPHVHWYKLVSRRECATQLQYQRFLALTESTNNPINTAPQKLQLLAQRRVEAGSLKNIPMSPYSDLASQYREPADLTKRYIRSYVRHVARTQKHPTDPDRRIRRIKVYRLIHQIIIAPHVEAGLSPLDPCLYTPFYQGEFDADGNLQGPRAGLPPAFHQPIKFKFLNNAGVVEDAEEPAQDPFLYWMLPITREPDPTVAKPVFPRDYYIVDTLTREAGDCPVPEWEDFDR
jgi:hypothetical protein